MRPTKPGSAAGSNESGSTSTTCTPSGAARVLTTSITCRCSVFATAIVAPLPTEPAPCLFVTHMRIASAAAVPSSSSEHVDTGSPVRSLTTVWYASIASSRPCATSAWYGVYGVYHDGSSSTFRVITDGATHP